MNRLLFNASCIVLVTLLSSFVMAEGLTALGDSELSQIAGREGVALDFTYAMNAYETDRDGHEAGDPLASLANCSDLQNPCSLGITVSNRDGLWVMLKDLYGIQKINNFWIDGRETKDVSYNPALADTSRFDDGAGCVLPGDSGAACTASARQLPALAMSYGPASGDGYATFETDVEWHLHIGRVSVQYDDAGGAAYLPANDKPGSFMSYQITDMHQKMAKFDYDGAVIMYGW